MKRIIRWLRKTQNPIMRLSMFGSTNYFHGLIGETETRFDRMTLTLIEKTSTGPNWNVKVEGSKNFKLFSDELVINLGVQRPAIKFTSEGMKTVCPKCGGEVRYGLKGKVTNWWCTECEHHKSPS